MPKKEKKKKKKAKLPGDKRMLINKLMGIFSNNPTQSFNYKQVAKRLEIKSTGNKQLVAELLALLASRGSITEVYPGKYKLNSKAGNIIGKVDLTKSGYAYIIPEDDGEHVFVSQKNLHHALDGDTVKVYCFARKRSTKLEGEVVEILHRARTKFVGIIEISRNFAFLIPDSKVPFDLFIPLEKLNGAENGEKAIAEITNWPENVKNPYAEVVEVLGKPGEHEVEMHAILAEYGLPLKFPAEVEQEANEIEDKIPPDEINNRRDFRKINTFTIDPADAKDFDDALSIQHLENGNWKIGVHIADVTYYVRSKTILDHEALERGTSVYLVDRVVPMLPEKLSNNICSLRPNEDKLCYSAVFEMNDHAGIIDQWFGRTIINSNKRFTYEEAQEIIENGNGEYKDEIMKLHDLAQKLRKKRYDNGSIAFERLEVKFNIDEFGKPLGVFYKEHTESNQLIEEFMLLANKRVAELIGKPKAGIKPTTFVYRVHDKPNQEKLETFNNFIKKFGYDLILTNKKTISASMNSLLDEVRGKNEQNIIETLAVRSMAKAEYSTINIGHYGLAFDFYTHFTSPIRRYPDMLVHRLLDNFLKDGKSKNREKYEAMCQQASEMERLATEAERASIKYKQVEFMLDKIGNKYTGIISGVTDWGLFVEIEENRCEGLVSLRELDDDFYEMDEESYCLIGRNTDKRYQLGDMVKIKVIRVDLTKRHLDFSIVEEG